MNTQTDTETAHEILSYFVRNPQAADDLEGVARWRLLNEIVTRQVDDTRRALQWLVARGFLCEAKTLGTEAIYRLNEEKTQEAREFLAASRQDCAERSR
jgi:hypothetical protein